MLSFIPSKAWVYPVELAVIVLGILIAFQVEEFRDRRIEARELAAALERLAEETGHNRETCDYSLPLLEDSATSVRHVYESLVRNAIVADDRQRFERGLVVFSVVPDIRMQTTVAQEMIATGLLKELDDPALRQQLPNLITLDQQAHEQLVYFREGIISLQNRIMTLADYRFAGDIPSLDALVDGPWLEDAMRVDYDLDHLAADRLLVNLFFEAVDIHADTWLGLEERCRVIAAIEERLAGTWAAASAGPVAPSAANN